MEKTSKKILGVKFQHLRLLLVLGMLIQFFSPFVQEAHAGTLTSTYVRLNRMKAATATSFRLVFTTSSGGAGANSVVVDFNGSIDTGGAAWTTATPTAGLIGATGSQTVSTATCPAESGAIAVPGTLTGSSSGSTVIVSTSGTLSASTAYCVDFTFASAVTTPSAGEFHPSVTTKTTGVATDTTNIAVRVIANDQVTINAVVPPIFTFVINSATANFVSNLSLTNTIQTSATTVTITTNAASGWITWVKGTNTATTGTANYGALKSATAANYTIPSNATGTLGAASHFNTPGTPDYGLGVTSITDFAGGGTVSADAAYNSIANPTCTTASTCKLGGLDTSIYRPIASSTGTASGTGDVVSFKEAADIDGATPAATDYADTLTVIGAGKF